MGTVDDGLSEYHGVGVGGHGRKQLVGQGCVDHMLSNASASDPSDFIIHGVG
jgi:hypothetical protein